MSISKTTWVRIASQSAVMLAAFFVGHASLRAAGTLFVADTTTGPTDLIHAYNAGTGQSIAPDISLLGVTGLAIGPSGNLFAVTSNPGFQPDTGSVYQYDPTTHAKIGGPYVTFNGQNDGHDVQGPNGMQFGATGNLYIADTTESNAHIYGTTSNSLGALRVPSSFSRRMWRSTPAAICMSPAEMPIFCVPPPGPAR